MQPDKMSPGQECRIRGVQVEGAELQRLLDSGFMEGTRLEIVRFAPLLDPLDLEIRGYLAAIRRTGGRVSGGRDPIKRDR